MIRRIGLMAWKETRHILRDVSTLYMAFGVPLVLLALFGYALTLDVEHIAMVVVDDDHTAESRDLVGRFERTGFFDVVGRPDDPAAVLGAFRRGDARAALFVPRGTARALDRGERAHVQLVVDGTNANVASIAIAYGEAAGEVMSLDVDLQTLDRLGIAGGQRIGPPLNVTSRNWFNPDLRSQWYLVPGLVAVIMAMMSAILMALTVAREWERGTMEQLLVTPARPIEILLGKLIPYFVIGLGQLTLVAGAGVLLFGVPIAGSLALLYGLSSLFLVGALGQGLLISVITRQQQLAMQISLITSLLPAILLSGFMAPVSSMPEVLQWLSRIIPARYLLVVTRTLFLKGSGLSTLWPQAVALLVFATVVMFLGVTRMKTRLD